MEVLPCGHVANRAPGRMCPHLIELGEDAYEHVRLLTGNTLVYDACCGECDRTRTSGAPIDLLEVCEGCASVLAEEQIGTLMGWRGEPGVLERPEPVSSSVADIELPAGLGEPVDLAPIVDGVSSTWLMLTEKDELVRFDASRRDARVLATSELPAEPGQDHSYRDHRPTRRLHVSRNGRFAAVVHDYGRTGEVIGLRSGARLMHLDGGSYHEDTVRFSLCFLEVDGRTLVVHRTAWNVLAVSDPLTGTRLRSQPEGGWLFHGRLQPSPNGSWVADDGWVWHPVGVPTVFDTEGWLKADPGSVPASLQLAQRDYCWDLPMCWLDDKLVILGGIGHDDDFILDGARVFNVETGSEISAFAGPRGAFFADGRRLYCSAADGTEIWDPFTGERTGTVPGFTARRHHPGTGELAALEGSTLRLWKPDPT